MNLINGFSKIVEAYSQCEPVTVVTDFENTASLLKQILSLPNTRIVSVDLADSSWSDYCGAYVLSLNNDGSLFCQTAIGKNGNLYRGGGLYLIDETAIGAYQPEDFVFEGNEAKIEMI